MRLDHEVYGRRNSAQAKKSAAIVGLAMVVFRDGMLMARPILVDVGLPCRKMVVSETMRRGRAVIKCNSGGGADDAQCIQDNE